jgi:hypothetical protein
MKRGAFMSKKILPLLRFSGLSMVILLSVIRAGNCELLDCGTLYYKCWNNGNINCSAYADPQFYDPGEKRKDIMDNAVSVCTYNYAPSSEHCNLGVNIIMDAKDPPMCTQSNAIVFKRL